MTTQALCQPDLSRRAYWRALNEAHAYAYRSRQQEDPVLAEHFAGLARVSFDYAKALRTGDLSLTPIRPLAWFAAQTGRAAA